MRQLPRGPKATAEARVEDLLSRMSVEEKIGQMTLPEKDSVKKGDVARLGLGGVLSGGDGVPRYNTPASWLEMVSGFQEEALRGRLGIPMIYGVDAVHGHAAVHGATVFPHNAGLGAARDAQLVERIGRATALETVATGIRWDYAPVVAVPQDLRWGRTYECYGQDPKLVTGLASAYVRGLQDGDPSDPLSVLATPKHFVADGAAKWGTSSTVMLGCRFSIDQGDVKGDEGTLRAVHLLPYEAAIRAGALCIMVSFTSWQGTKMHAHRYLLTELLKGELGFSGFLVSDWGAIDQLPGDHYAQVVAAINAGLDMIMVPYHYCQFIEDLTRAVNAGDIPCGRIDDAVRRILKAKLALGLFEHPLAQGELLAKVGCAAHRDLAREAVRKSLCLLKDDNVLPLPKDALIILVGGEAADDLGIQCGGWTAGWQGKRGRVVPGTTILEGIRGIVHSEAIVQFDPNGSFENVAEGEVGIAVVGEEPYAEGFGDRAEIVLTEADINLIRRMRPKVKKLVLLIISGRPLVLHEAYDLADAVVAAWLPGSEGDGVADVLFGDFPFTGRLPFAWPRFMAGLDPDAREEPLFPMDYGLRSSGP